MSKKTHLHCITLYYAQQKISWKPGKTSKFGPIHSTIQIWTDFHENEAKKGSSFLDGLQLQECDQNAAASLCCIGSKVELPSKKTNLI